MKALILLFVSFFASTALAGIQNFGDHIAALDLQQVASVSATANGTGIDRQGYEGQIAVFISAHKVSGTTPTLDLKLQDSADNSTFADVSGAAFTQVTTTDSSQKLILNRDGGLKRYVRIVETLGGTSPVYLIVAKAIAYPKYPQ